MMLQEMQDSESLRCVYRVLSMRILPLAIAMTPALALSTLL
jgi:hypothetical protein